MSISIWKTPIKTLGYSKNEVYYHGNRFITDNIYCLTTIFILGTIWILLINIPTLYFGNNHEVQDNMIIISNYLYWCIYWFILGVLSSIGFGTGLHTGILFLFPWVIQTNSIVHSCNTIQFSVLEEYDCNLNNISNNNTDFTIMDLFYKTIPTVMIWSLGCAFGEIPPFLISRYVRRGKISENSNELEEQEFLLKLYDEYPNSKWLMEWMFTHLRKNGFKIITFFASYPNALFDMCGMCCGYLDIPFSTFLSATVLGKVFIKGPLQLLIILTIIHPKFTEDYVLKLYNIFPYKIATWLENKSIYYGDLLNGNIEENGEGYDLKYYWSIFVILCTMWFFISMIEEFARSWEKRENKKIK